MKIKVEAISDKGCVRSKNEDMILIDGIFLRDNSYFRELEINEQSFQRIFAVADGIGGHKGGEYASEIVLTQMDLLARSIQSNLNFAELKEFLDKEIRSIHQFLLHQGISDPEKSGMGSTFVGLLLYQNKVFLINIGDSQCYRFRNGFLSQLSRDHTLREMSGNQHVAANIIINSFGGGESIFFDFADISEKIMPGDAILLCSDGLTNELGIEEIESILENRENIGSLLEKAKQNGGKDNISILIISFS